MVRATTGFGSDPRGMFFFDSGLNSGIFFSTFQVGTQPMSTTVRQTFDALMQEIKRAIEERNFFSVCNRATALGLTGGQADTKCAVWYQYKSVDPTGATLSLRARSYDPSGPTQARPGVTRFTVTAIENGAVTLHYEDEYEGLVST
jgi:hypothetical protein